jgi:PTH1 family peptidyl-tRNA hydrolase
MIIIIGLGNPGIKFQNTRHNVGFTAIDEFAKENNFPEFKLQKKSNALISDKNGVILVKPQTFMNESGKAIKEIISNKETSNIVVIHDDIDLPVGKIKIVKERGSAGHKGVESIIQSISNDGLIRLRVGIGPASAKASAVKAIDVVLEKFSEQEQELIDSVVKKAAKAIDLFIKEGLDSAMNEYNK